MGIYTGPLFGTKGEAEDVEVVARYSNAASPLVGLVLYGDAKPVSNALAGSKLYS